MKKISIKQQHFLFTLARLGPALLLAVIVSFQLAPAAYAAGFIVDTTNDTVDSNPGNGVCADAGGNCSLRAAIMETNALTGSDSVTVPVGTFTLTRTGRLEDAAQTGDLDITGNVTLNGAGATSTIIQAGVTTATSVDRVFHIPVGGITVDINGVTVKNGVPETDAWGGGLFNEGNGTLNILNSTISNNEATYQSKSVVGGGIANTSTHGGVLFIKDSAVIGNKVTGVFTTSKRGIGGGIFNNKGATSTIVNSTISGNTAAHRGGGLQNEGTAVITNSTFYGNDAPIGGNIRTFFTGSATYVANSILAAPIQGGNCSNKTGSTISRGYNIEDANDCNFISTGDITTTNPLLGPLQDNGGETLTYALLPGSLAVDAGTNSSCPATDQRGVARPVDGDRNGTATCDMGAFETAPIFSVAKTATDANGALLEPGDRITYTLVLSNSGNLSATNVTISDTVPANTSFVADSVTISPPGGITGTPPGIAGGITVTTQSPATVTYAVTVAVPVTNGTVITNTVSVTNSDASDPVTDSVSSVVSAPILQISKAVTPNTNVARYGEITYTVVVSNSGGADANGLQVTDTLPISVTFGRWIEPPPGAVTNTVGGRDQITWNGAVSAGAPVTFTFVAAYTGTYSDVVINTVEYDYPANLGSGTAGDTFTVIGPPEITVSPASLDFGSRHITAGPTSTQTVTITNDGAAALSISSVSLEGGDAGHYKIVGDSGETMLPAGSSRTVSVYFDPGSSGLLNNANLRIISDDSDEHIVNVSLSGTGAVLQIGKTVSPDTNVARSGEVTYTVVITNSDGSDANGVLVTDTLPISVTFGRWIEQPSGATVNSAGGRDQITWNGTVGSSTPVNFTFVATRTGNYSDVVINTAEFNYPAILTSGTAEITFTVIGPPEITVSPMSLDFGSRSITDGPTSAQVVTITNDGAAALSISSVSLKEGDAGHYNIVGDSRETTLPAGSSRTVQVNFDPGSSGLLNNASLRIISDDSDEPTVDVSLSGSGTSPALQISKTVSPDTDVAYHGEVTYTVVMNNSGGADAHGVLVTDTLPISTTFGRWITPPPGAITGTVGGRDQMTWSGAVRVGAPVTFVFVATHTGSGSDVVTNTAGYAHPALGSSGSDDAVFSVEQLLYYLPIVLRNFPSE